ncbi:MAG TPA: PfkB family carbohydrate kinase [Longimicrobiales bacterium]
MERLRLKRVEELLAAARDVRVLVVGDLMLDRYISGSVSRISPEAPVPVVRVEEETVAMGGAANVASNVVALGAACDIVGCTGDDDDGRRLREALDVAGVRTRGIVSTRERPTTVKTRVLARRQQVVRVDREQDGDVEDALAAALAGAIHELASECHVVAVEDYNKGVLVPRVIDAALGRDGAHQLPTVVDPKRLRFFGFGGCSVFKPNALELADALGEGLQPEESRWMSETRGRLMCDNLLLTMGESGMALQTADAEYVRIPAVARSVYDVSGAGDTVTAVTAVCLAAGATMAEAAILANHAAAIEVGKAGVATVSPEEILLQYRTHKRA